MSSFILIMKSKSINKMFDDSWLYISFHLESIHLLLFINFQLNVVFYPYLTLIFKFCIIVLWNLHQLTKCLTIHDFISPFPFGINTSITQVNRFYERYFYSLWSLIHLNLLIINYYMICVSTIYSHNISIFGNVSGLDIM